MMVIKGLQQAAMAALAMVSVSAWAKPCTDITDDPANFQVVLRMLDNAAQFGPPEIALGAAALRAGHWSEGLNLLVKAGNIPNAELLRRPINRRFDDAVLTARSTVWEIRGCPEDRNAGYSYDGTPQPALAPYQK